MEEKTNQQRIEENNAKIDSITALVNTLPENQSHLIEEAETLTEEILS